MSELKLRSYKQSDEPQVVKLWRHVFPDSPPWNDPHKDIARKLSVQRELFIVAVLEDELVGTAVGGYDGHRGWVYYVAVKPDLRRQGIGAALMQRVEQDLAELGCPKLNLQIRAENTDVVAFYESLGYHVEERVSMGKRLINDKDGRTNTPRHN